MVWQVKSQFVALVVCYGNILWLRIYKLEGQTICQKQNTYTHMYYNENNSICYFNKVINTVYYAAIYNK